MSAAMPTVVSMPVPREPYELRSRSRAPAPPPVEKEQTARVEEPLSRWTTRNRDGTLIVPLTSAGWDTEPVASVRMTVKTLTGKSITLDACPTNITLLGLKELVRDREGIPPEMQHLVWAGYMLTNNEAQIMRDYGIMWDSTFHLVLRCAGD